MAYSAESRIQRPFRTKYQGTTVWPLSQFLSECRNQPAAHAEPTAAASATAITNNSASTGHSYLSLYLYSHAGFSIRKWTQSMLTVSPVLYR